MEHFEWLAGHQQNICDRLLKPQIHYEQRILMQLAQGNSGVSHEKQLNSVLVLCDKVCLHTA